MVYFVLEAVGPRAAAAPVALPLGNDGSRPWSSRRHGSSLRGLLRSHGKCRVELDKVPEVNHTKRKIGPRILLEFVLFEFQFKTPAW